MAKKVQKTNTRTGEVILLNEKEVASFGDEQEVRDSFLSLDVKFKTAGETFQGILLGMFTAPPKDDREDESTGYNFLTLDGQKATVWGGVVLNKLMPQIAKPPMFVTITYKGLNKRTKTYRVVASAKGLAQHKHLLKGIDLDEYQWFEEIPI